MSTQVRHITIETETIRPTVTTKNVGKMRRLCHEVFDWYWKNSNLASSLHNYDVGTTHVGWGPANATYVLTQALPSTPQRTTHKLTKPQPS